MVSVNMKEEVLKLTNQKCLSDEIVLKKIERFSKQGVERDFFIDGNKIAKIIPRLNQIKDAQKWLSMQPNPLRYIDGYRYGFGDVNEDNDLHGRGIQIWNGGIHFGYYENGRDSTGHYIEINSVGWFNVGECYMKDERRWWRGTKYKTDDTEEQYDYRW